jgi:predicted lipoprotein with Yx(FWY)xxD motif/plastocyanin
MSASVLAADSTNVKSDTQIAAELGILQGDGTGVTAEYLAKSTTRIQAAILFLRLKGLEADALAFKGMDNFADATAVSDSNKMIMAYLKANPSLGWTGIGNNTLDPLSIVTAQQYEKVMLETLGYMQGTDFEYKDVFKFSATLGLTRVAKVDLFRNSHIATATIEAIQVKVKGGTKKLLDILVEQKKISALQTASLSIARVDFATSATLGTYLVDGNGKTLYTFTKDQADTNACKDQCLTTWPIFYQEKLQVPAALDASDFGVLTRPDGTKQTTYKGWPLYYYVKDKAGDTLGHALNNIWFVAKGSNTVALTSKPDLGNFLVDGNGVSLYYYDKDMKGMSVCNGNCLVNWPIYYSEYTVVPDGLKAEDFGSIVREDGRMMSTYKGYPLYYYIKDKVKGDVTGQNVGKIWFVIDPAKFNGTAADAGMSSTPPPTPASAPPKPAAPAPPAPPVATSKTYNIDMKNFAFSNLELTIEVGSTVIFTNQDGTNHNAQAVDGSFETKLLAKGESASVTFNKAGTFDYFCMPHKDFMTAKIIVK